MLSFLNASMAISTQRYLSVAIGNRDSEQLNRIYTSSIVLHLLFGIVIVCLFEICFFPIFSGFLNIEPDRVTAAKFVYQFLVVSTFFTILSVPYGAVMNAKENMLAFSIIDILDSVLKLALALSLKYISCDRLVVYGLVLALISILNTVINRLYVHLRYKEFSFDFKHFMHKDTLMSMLGFAGWNTLGAVAMIGRNQGISIVFNLFFGTVANAAYGVANQINGVLAYFSRTFQKALNPQLMQSEGMHDNQRLIKFSLISSKYSVLVLAIFALPLIMEMPYVLELWLKDVPEYTLRLCQFVVALGLLYQYSSGLMSSIQAVGKIKWYFICISTLILLNIPICYYVLKCGAEPYSCIIVFIIIEFVCLLTRLAMARHYVNISFASFFKEVVAPTSVCMMSGLLLSLPCHFLMEESFLRLVVVCISYAVGYLTAAWVFAMEDELKQTVIKFVRKHAKE